jgi:hypothetical protein
LAGVEVKMEAGAVVASLTVVGVMTMVVGVPRTVVGVPMTVVGVSMTVEVGRTRVVAVVMMVGVVMMKEEVAMMKEEVAMMLAVVELMLAVVELMMVEVVSKRVVEEVLWVEVVLEDQRVGDRVPHLRHHLEEGHPVLPHHHIRQYHQGEVSQALHHRPLHPR